MHQHEHTGAGDDVGCRAIGADTAVNPFAKDQLLPDRRGYYRQQNALRQGVGADALLDDVACGRSFDHRDQLV